MDRTFNNGIGMILVVGARQGDRVQAALKRMGEASFIVGEVRNGARGARIRS
jgi:phosphoribosylformylglycinamidine cyclo-ligase